MPYAEPYLYLRALGVFGAAATSPVESWGVGFKFRHPEAPPSSASLSAFLETASVPLANFHISAVRAGANCFLTELTAAMIGTDGKYLGGGTQQTRHYFYGSPPVGISTSSAPWTQALVLSLRTQISRGPGSNGRIYYPAPALTVDGPTGTLTTTQVNGILPAAKALLDGLNSAKQATMPSTGGLAVMSNVGTGVAATVTAVRIGRRLDRQERRENDVSEGYISTNLAAAAALISRNEGRRVGEPLEH